MVAGCAGPCVLDKPVRSITPLKAGTARACRAGPPKARARRGERRTRRRKAAPLDQIRHNSATQRKCRLPLVLCSRTLLGRPGWPTVMDAVQSGPGLGWCRKVDSADSAPVPEPFGAMLDDETDCADLNLAFFLLRPQGRDDRCHGLVCRAIADGDVRNPARRIAVRVMQRLPVATGSHRRWRGKTSPNMRSSGYETGC